MAITVSTLVGKGIQTGFEGYGPAVRQKFTGVIAAAANVAAIKVPYRSIPRRLVLFVEVPNVAACTLDVGTSKSGVFDDDSIESTGKAIGVALAPAGTSYVWDLDASPALAGNEDYITFTPSAEIDADAKFHFVLFCDVVDPTADLA